MGKTQMVVDWQTKTFPNHIKASTHHWHMNWLKFTSPLVSTSLHILFQPVKKDVLQKSEFIYENVTGIKY